MLLGFVWLSASIILSAVGVRGHRIRRQDQNQCPPFNNGTIVIDSYQLYPENADFDLNQCLLYFGALFNASVVVYDPYRAETVSTIELPGITRTKPFHVGGVAWDPYTNLITILADSSIPHETDDHEILGDDFLIRYDPAKNEIVWSLNLTEVSQGQYGGNQDVEHDSHGHIYVLGTYPGSILRAEADGSSIKPWYLPDVIDHTNYGITGFAATGDILLASDGKNNSGSGEIYRFNMTADKGTPVLVPKVPDEAIMSLDAVYLPPKYGGKVLLVSEHDRGVSVLRSADGKWESAEYLGRITDDPNFADGGFNTATVEVSGSIYAVDEWFSDPIVAGTSAGNRTKFPLVDITSQVEALLG
ncbi:uncharacterized protein F4822DRAFT_147368 [Hypoxylon trugodes]|uniref:uncharacterized protein n=1 Tax=Hypoxylon trugodes TaxID=326681 RepID=UPI00219BBEB6|nr:uncharacterized protein F4822DRAFT_147368 [Hypoxylon trugodes]KAI1392980.1 hypothetical protein F4822DRAFT_147368 [Hypoxylon trugodes]